MKKAKKILLEFVKTGSFTIAGEVVGHYGHSKIKAAINIVGFLI